MFSCFNQLDKFDSVLPIKTYGRMLFTLVASSSMFQNFHFIARSQVTTTSFIISAHLDDHKDIRKMHTEQPFKECLLHYQLSKA